MQNNYQNAMANGMDPATAQLSTIASKSVELVQTLDDDRKFGYTPEDQSRNLALLADAQTKIEAMKAGMTVDQVREVMGTQGSTLSQADNGSSSSIVISWQDPKASSHQVIVSFVNNVMMSKSAIGF